MDVHPTKNVSIGIDPYPYIPCIYRYVHLKPCRPSKDGQRGQAARLFGETFDARTVLPGVSWAPGSGAIRKRRTWDIWDD
jgi:hypothetical protein